MLLFAPPPPPANSAKLLNVFLIASATLHPTHVGLCVELDDS